jgi:hypothetical protein
MGVVYEAVDLQLGVPVALKFLHHFRPRTLYRLKREFQTMNALAPHPNLITPSGLFCERGVWFVSMELVRGEPFSRWVRPGGALDHARLNAALVQLAHGLQAIHRAGLVHRDLKPSNVLVTGEGRLVILDFGLVSDSALDQHDTRQGLAGTPRYMAPEQAQGAPATPASDCYALGVMLYEALSGETPFAQASIDTVVAKQQRDVPVLQLPPGLPEEFGALCKSLLSRDPVVRPGPGQILALLGHAGADSDDQLQRPRRSALVGRADDLTALHSALQRTDLGAPQLVLIEGESGIGKSALVEAFVEALPPDMVALRGRCYARADVPYKACDGLIDELSRFLSSAATEDAQRWAPQDLDALTQMFPVLGRVAALEGAVRRGGALSDAHELRRRGAAALRELLGRMASEQPVMLFIDDLQWGDADSAGLLRELLRAPAAPPLLFVGAYRSEARNGEFVRAVRGLAAESEIALQTLVLEVLQGDVTAELARRLLGDDRDERVVATIARESSGMPLFVRELSAQARQGILGNGHDGSVGTGVLVGAIMRRVATLAPHSRKVLDLVSIAHAPLPESVILRAAQLGADAPTAVHVLSAHAMLRMTSDGRLDTYHDRVRESVAASMTSEHKCALHAALATALEGSERAQPDWLAAHALAAGLTDLGLRATLEAAEDAMAKLAFDRAATNYRTALGLLREGDPKRAALLLKLGDAYRLDGRGRDAGDAYTESAQFAEGLDRSDRLVRACLMYMNSAYVDRGIEVMLPVLAELRLSIPVKLWHARLLFVFQMLAVRWLEPRFRERDEKTIDRALLTRIEACHSVGLGLLILEDISGRSVLFLARALRFALRAGAASYAAYVQTVIASAPGGLDRLERDSQPAFDKHLAFARRTGNADLQAWVQLCRSMGHIHVLRPGSALEYAREAERICEQNNIFAGFTRVSADQTVQISLMLAGRLKELGAVAPEHARRAHARSDIFGWTRARIYDALAALAADQPERAFAESTEAIALWARGEHWQRWRQRFSLWPNSAHALYVQVWALSYQGRGGAARETVLKIWPELGALLRTPVWRVFLTWTRGAAALAAADEGVDRDEALRDARGCVRALVRVKQQPAVFPLAALLQAGLAASGGDLATARERLAFAGDRFDAIGMQLFGASARRRLATLLPGEESAQMLQIEAARMRALGVAVPERWIAVYTPGFG